MAANAASFSIEETSIAALHAAYLSGRATAVSVCKAHLDRIAAYDRKGPALGAIIINNPDALADAAALDAALVSTGRLIGPLHGIPVLVKDNYDVTGLQTTGGSAALLGWVPAADATVIAKIRAAGGVILAKTTMSEWARGGLDNINSVLPPFFAQSLQYRLCYRRVLGWHGVRARRKFRCRGPRIRHFWLDPKSCLEQCSGWVAHKLGVGFPGRHGWTLRQARHRRSDGPHRYRPRATTGRHRWYRPGGPGDRRGGRQDPADLQFVSKTGRCRGPADRCASSGMPPGCFRPASPCLV